MVQVTRLIDMHVSLSNRRIQQSTKESRMHRFDRWSVAKIVLIVEMIQPNLPGNSQNGIKRADFQVLDPRREATRISVRSLEKPLTRP